MSQVFGNQPYNANIWQKHLEPVENITQQAVPQIGRNVSLGNHSIVPQQSIWNNPNLTQANSLANNKDLVPQNMAMMQTQGQNFIDNQPGFLSQAWDSMSNGLGSLTEEGGLFTMKEALGGSKGPGWLTGLANAGANAVGAYTGYQQYKLGKDQLAFNRGVTETNLANQANLINQQMDRKEELRRSYLSPAEQAKQISMDEFRKENNVVGRV